jgi:hypothetical protein
VLPIDAINAGWGHKSQWATDLRVANQRADVIPAKAGTQASALRQR